MIFVHGNLTRSIVELEFWTVSLASLFGDRLCSGGHSTRFGLSLVTTAFHGVRLF